MTPGQLLAIGLLAVVAVAGGLVISTFRPGQTRTELVALIPRDGIAVVAIPGGGAEQSVGVHGLGRPHPVGIGSVLIG